MTQIMTPSHEPMTDGQIDKAVAHYRDMLKKHRTEIGASDAVQQVLGSSEYLAEQLTVIRKRVEVMSKMIVRRVTVDRTRTPQQALDATCRKQYVDEKVFATVPQGKGVEVDVHFFNLDYDPTTKELAREYEVRGLGPDFAAQAAVNEADKTFADDHPNCLQWDLDKNGVASYTIFNRWHGGRGVIVDRHGNRWNRTYRFGGVRK